MNNKLLIILSFLITLVSCNTEVNKSDDKGKNLSIIDTNGQVDTIAQVENIKKILKQFDYKTSIVKVGDTIKIELSVDAEDYHSPYFVKIVKELILVAISKDIQLNDKIIITEVLPNNVKNKTLDIANYKIVQDLVAFNNQYQTTFNFKKYIYKNIRREKLMKFNAIIEDLLVDRPNVPLKEKDFIVVIMNYADDCMGLRKDVFYTKLLKAIKEVASDKTLWSDFNSRDIDYFLEYCNKSDSKNI